MQNRTNKLIQKPRQIVPVSFQFLRLQKENLRISLTISSKDEDWVLLHYLYLKSVFFIFQEHTCENRFTQKIAKTALLKSMIWVKTIFPSMFLKKVLNFEIDSLAHTCHAQSSDCQGCLFSKP